jgi:hypothetical protein
VPSSEQATRAADVIARLVPTLRRIADQPELRLRSNIEFVHAGDNFGAIRCPVCGQEFREAVAGRPSALWSALVPAPGSEPLQRDV